MNILFITGEYPPQTGGVGAYTAELSHALIQLGLTVHVLTTQKIAVNHPVTRQQPTLAQDGPTLHPLVDKWGLLSAAIVRRVAEQTNADWIHVQYQTAAFGMNPTINCVPYWWQASIKKENPAAANVAWTYHDLLVPYLFPKAGSRPRNWLTERPARDCDLTITTNLGDFNALTERQPDHARTFANIPIGSNITGRHITADEKSTLRHALGYTKENSIIAYFGFLNRSKGGITLIDTLHELAKSDSNVRLLMIGERVGASDPTNYAYLQEVESHIDALGLQDKVQWTGRLDDHEVSAHLAASDVLFMPYEDGASLRRGTLMAGLVNSCAIVTTSPQAPLPELVHERDLLYVPPRDPHAATAALTRLMAEPRLADRLRKNAGERSALFSWEKIAKKHVELYERYR